MADIHILPTRTNEVDVDHMSKLLSAALADGIDLGPRGHHTQVLVLSLQENLAELREIAAELGKSPVRDRFGLVAAASSLMPLSDLQVPVTLASLDPTATPAGTPDLP